MNVCESPPDPHDDDLEDTPEGNFGAPQIDPRTAELSAADAYSRPLRGELSDVSVDVTIVETPEGDDERDE